jgi:hypothetical protein
MKLFYKAIKLTPEKAYILYIATAIYLLFLASFGKSFANTSPDKILKIGGSKIEVFLLQVLQEVVTLPVSKM